MDEDVQSTFHADQDGDGWGDPSSPLLACDRPEGAVEDASDCDDQAPQVHPDAPELCDGVDLDCDGAVDEDVQSTLYQDQDRDGWGDSSLPLLACAPSEGVVVDATDCDDGDPDRHPGAPEACNGLDDDCDDLADEGLLDTWYQDGDGDGHGDREVEVEACDPGVGWVSSPEDCDDTEPLAHPGADERCNGVDDDCDGEVDEDDAVDASPSYRDGDGDGFGATSDTVLSCAPPSGYVPISGDCDDGDPRLSPHALEVCDGVDNNCDGATDGVDAADALPWHPDGDGDGWGDASTVSLACASPEGFLEDASDCDDTLASVHPGAAETCDGGDQDCDGTVDDDPVDGILAWPDADGDGWGDPDGTLRTCALPGGWVELGEDCDDARADVSPTALESCDGFDNDCDGFTDEAGSLGESTWYADTDGDGWGDVAAPTSACGPPPGFVTDAGDCDDGDASTSPAALERCDGADDDCDGVIDEPSAVDAATWYADGDADGWGDALIRAVSCDVLEGLVSAWGDCDDGDATAWPGAPETCDGVDDDCDGTADEDPVDGLTWHPDADGDGFGDPSTSRVECLLPYGYTLDGTDCHDDDITAWPGSDAWEIIGDGVDQDCDGYDGCSDLDCDGLPDVVVPSMRTDTSYVTQAPVHYGTPTGFSSTADLWIDVKGCRGLAHEDLDHDGYQDLVVVNYYDGTTWSVDSLVLWGAPGGLSTASRTVLPTTGALGVTIRDLDQDGWLDILFPSYRSTSTFSNDAYIYWGSADGYSTADRAALPVTGAFTHLVADLDGDGWDDLFFPSYSNGTTFSSTGILYWGSSTGFSASAVSTLPTTGTVDALASDLDGDGDQDLVLVSYYSGTSYTSSSQVVWNGGGTFSTTTNLSTVGARAVVAEDLDQDGWPDLAFASYYNGTTYTSSSPIFWGSAAGYSASDSTTLPTLGALDVAAADLDGDGWLDLIYANYNDNTSTNVNSYIYWGSSTGYSTAARTGLPTQGAARVVVADADGDGAMDLAFSNHYSSTYSVSSYIYYNRSGTFGTSARNTLPAWGPWTEMAVVGP